MLAGYCDCEKTVWESKSGTNTVSMTEWEMPLSPSLSGCNFLLLCEAKKKKDYHIQQQLGVNGRSQRFQELPDLQWINVPMNTSRRRRGVQIHPDVFTSSGYRALLRLTLGGAVLGIMSGHQTNRNNKDVRQPAETAGATDVTSVHTNTRQNKWNHLYGWTWDNWGLPFTTMFRYMQQTNIMWWRDMWDQADYCPAKWAVLKLASVVP